MTDEMEYMNISQYCLNLIKNNIKLFLETKYKSIIEKEYKSSDDSFFDVMFYFNVLKNLHILAHQLHKLELFPISIY
jgi:hypothetical protein